MPGAQTLTCDENYSLLSLPAQGFLNCGAVQHRVIFYRR
jgi:hypothetical protein